MFDWKVEDMKLLNSPKVEVEGRHVNGMVCECELTTSREDKIAFVDSMNEGKLSYFLALCDKFESERDSLPTYDSQYGFKRINTNSLIAWIKRNETRFKGHMLDTTYQYGNFYLLGAERNIISNYARTYDLYDDFVDEVFHRQIEKCMDMEQTYFSSHDELSVLKKKIDELRAVYHTNFGLPLTWGLRLRLSDDATRELTLEEAKKLLATYEKLEAYDTELSASLDITP